MDLLVPETIQRDVLVRCNLSYLRNFVDQANNTDVFDSALGAFRWTVLSASDSAISLWPNDGRTQRVTTLPA